jgi:hypothetical protein
MNELRNKLTESAQDWGTGCSKWKSDCDHGQSLQPGQCVFCLRVLKDGTTEHHLIPRRCHKNRWFQKRFTREQMRETVPACGACHRAIHRFVPREKDLGRSFNTVSGLLAHPDFSRFVEWVGRQR